MRRNLQTMSRWVVAAAMLVLPVVLLLSSIRSLRELEETRNVYLRNRAATIAARLENLYPEQVGDDLFEMLADEEPVLLDLQIYSSSAEEPGNESLQSLWRGEALFATEKLTSDGQAVYRTYTPFHLGGDLRIARIDIAADAADYLVEHTRHHLLLSLLASMALVGFTGYFLWSEHRALRLQQQQFELEQLAQLGRMSAVLAHEIRNPLGTVKGFVQLASEQASDSVREMLGNVLGETDRLEKLVNDLLLYGRPREPQFKEVDWEELAGAVQAHAAENTGNRPTRFVRSGSLGRFRTDRDLLMQVLLNLVRNALEAAPDTAGGEIELSANRRADRTVAIILEDDGPGLPAEVRERLFEPFTTTKANGTGLGLSIARKLTEAMGGSIRIESREPQGTRVTLVFPG